MVRFEAKHGPCDALYEPVILFEDVVEVFLLPDGNQLPITLKFEDHIHRLKTRKIGATFVDVDQTRMAICRDSLLEETPRRSRVAAFGEHKIKGFPTPGH